MNKRAIAIIASTAVLFAVVVLLVYTQIKKEMPTPDSAPIEPQNTATTGAQSPGPATRANILYMVGEWNGKLAVFEASAITPSEVYDVYICSLPESEQQRLEQGIPVYDLETLAHLLEDYTS